eukprot:TRINITY_DN1398_c0_g1_i3.p1 TRINITY_DN1398_c0_g1~~TRINITY_DN1398_c0_g1_i3.p1  ORF type:complete len:1025 (-),score=278.85 TRINITY_DN1398_c0_g1_i3:41-3115(-)
MHKAMHKFKRKAKDEVDLKELEASGEVTGAFPISASADIAVEIETKAAEEWGDDHLISVEELTQRYAVQIDAKNPIKSPGLTEDEAVARFNKYGPNALTPPKGTPRWLAFIREFFGLFSIMMELAGIGCFVNYAINRKVENLFLGVVLWLVVIVSASLNYAQVHKSLKLMDSFGGMVAQKATVLRGGSQQTVDPSLMVIGDVVRIKSGDKIPADIRLIHCSEMKVDNSSLTGESDALSRAPTTSERHHLEAANIAFLGTLCVEGEGIGVVIRTGPRTMLGRTAALASRVNEEATVLQKEIQQFVKRISIVGITVGLIVLIVSLALKQPWLDSIVFGVGSIVAIVPEGLQLTVTLALTLCASRMAKQNVLVKKLSIVETLGCTSVICSDKTGTLTQNKMSVSYVVFNRIIHTFNNLAHSAERFNDDDVNFRSLIKTATLCNRATFDSSDPTGKSIIGDASETALLKFVSQVWNAAEMQTDSPKVVEIPFNSLNKWQLSIHRSLRSSGNFTLYMKGAPERILANCTSIYDNGEVKPLDLEMRKELESILAELGGHGQRVMGFSYLPLDPTVYHNEYAFNTADHNFPTNGLIFQGFIAMYDPPREGVADAIRICQGAGIRVVMVTGDHPYTAKAIAKEIGIITGKTPEELIAANPGTFMEDARRNAEAVVIAGTDIPLLSQVDWDVITSKSQIVFARTSPEQKLQIVEQFQKKGEVVAVTGDGVNDSPALKQAEVGVAMGITGSDVAKEAADIILMDDNFVTIVKAVEEGRLIFDNLKKCIAYGLSAKIPEVLPFLSFIILGLPLPLSTVLVLCIDIGTDLIPGISLAYEPPERNMMTRGPRNPRKHKLVSKKLIFFSLVQIGLIQTVSGFLSYFMTMADHGFPIGALFGSARKYFKPDAPDFYVGDRAFTADQQMDALAAAQTTFFCSIIMTQFADALICKTRFLSLFQSKSRNVMQALGIIIAIGVGIVFAFVPVFNYVLGTAPFNVTDWSLTLPFFFLILAQDELRKYIIRRNPKGKFAKYTFW